MKKYLTTSLLALVFVLPAASLYAATTDFVANGDITISSVSEAGVTADLTILNGSTAESWTFNSGVFSVTNPDLASFFRMRASGVSSIRVRDSNNTEVACSNGSNYVQLPPVSGTFDVFPSNSACTATGGGGSSSSSGSAPPPATPIVTPTVLVSLPPSSVNPPGITAARSAIQFTRSISLGTAGSDVRNLQQFLNRRGFVVALTGPGSAGNETFLFGPATRAALIKFQLANGIIASATVPGAGIAGPKTRAVINTGSNNVVPSVNVVTSPLNALLEVLRRLQTR